MAFSGRGAQHRHSHSPANSNLTNHSATACVLETVPNITPAYTARLQQPIASGYGNCVSGQLTQNVGPEPPHICSILTVGPGVYDGAENYRKCKDLFLHVKLRELMAALLGEFCGIPHANSADPGGLHPREHFLDWLTKTFNPVDMIFAAQPSQPYPPSQTARLQPGSNLQGNAAPTEPQSQGMPSPTTSAATLGTTMAGASSKICFSQLGKTFKALSHHAPLANHIVHSLTVGDAVRVLTDPNINALPLLDAEAIKCLTLLVESIIGNTIQHVASDWDSTLARTSFKEAAIRFRIGVVDTMLPAAIDRVWRPKYDEDAEHEQIQKLSKLGKVVSMAVVSSTKSDIWWYLD